MKFSNSNLSIYLPTYLHVPTYLYKHEAFRQLADTKFYAKVHKDPTLAMQSKHCQRYCSQQTHFRR